MVSHFAFEIQPIAVGQQDAKGDNLTDQYLAHSVEITTTFREIGDLSRMSFVVGMPLRIEMNT